MQLFPKTASQNLDWFNKSSMFKLNYDFAFQKHVDVHSNLTKMIHKQHMFAPVHCEVEDILQIPAQEIFQHDQ